MPVHQLPSGQWKWGTHGKAYPTKAEAETQAKAAYAHGYKGEDLATAGAPSGASPKKKQN